MTSKASMQLENERLRGELAEREARIAALRELIASLEGKQAALESTLINHASEIEVTVRDSEPADGFRGGESGAMVRACARARVERSGLV